MRVAAALKRAYHCEVFDAQMGAVCQKQCPECRQAEKDDLMNWEEAGEVREILNQ